MNLVAFGCKGFYLSHSLHSYPEMGSGVLQECAVEITVVSDSHGPSAVLNQVELLRASCC